MQSNETFHFAGIHRKKKQNERRTTNNNKNYNYNSNKCWMDKNEMIWYFIGFLLHTLVEAQKMATLICLILDISADFYKWKREREKGEERKKERKTLLGDKINGRKWLESKHFHTLCINTAAIMNERKHAHTSPHAWEMWI